jgi:hypothetical protein
MGIASLVGAGHASPTPPPTGDWIIEGWEDVTIIGEVLAPEGNVWVSGTLTLEGCTLELAPGKGLWSYNQLSCTNSDVTTTPGAIIVFDTNYGSQNRFTNCRLEFGDMRLRNGSTNTFAGCTLAGPFEGPNGFAGNSTNTFTDCTLIGFEFDAPSVNVLTDCTFVWTDLALGGRVILCTATEDTVVSYAHLAPGYQTKTIIADEADEFRVELERTTVGSFSLVTAGKSQWRLEDCQLRLLSCNDWSQTDLVDSHIGWFDVSMQRQGLYGPVNVLADGFRDDGTALTTMIWSDNTPFRVTFQNTDISGARVGGWNCRSLFWLGDNGGPGGSTNVIENCAIETLYSMEHSSLLVRNSTVTALGLASDYPGATARIVAEECQIRDLWLDGPATGAVLRDSDVSFVGFANYSGAQSSSPELQFELSDLGPWFAGAWPAVQVAPGVSGARISGTVQVDPSEWIYQWALGSTVIRTFPVLVKRPDGQPVAGAAVEVAHPPDPTIWWSGVSDADGFAYPAITFNDTNNSTEFTVSAAQGGAAESAPLAFLSSTPVELVLPVVYQIQWVPPLHDGTSVEAPDGPFKRGRTIPVKFRLLDAEGQAVPDEIAQGLVATLQVFYEAPCTDGTPVDPGNYPPDSGDAFRYEGGMFHYNLSTQDPAWLANYTYGLEVLIDGSPVGEVYFSLR